MFALGRKIRLWIIGLRARRGRRSILCQCRMNVILLGCGMRMGRILISRLVITWISMVGIWIMRMLRMCMGHVLR